MCIKFEIINTWCGHTRPQILLCGKECAENEIETREIKRECCCSNDCCAAQLKPLVDRHSESQQQELAWLSGNSVLACAIMPPRRSREDVDRIAKQNEAVTMELYGDLRAAIQRHRTCWQRRSVRIQEAGS